MVYEQEGKRWIFFHDLFGHWQWAVTDETGVTLEQATSSFRSCCSCMRDAKTRGFRVLRARPVSHRPDRAANAGGRPSTADGV
jgi:hypothetical protein